MGLLNWIPSLEARRALKDSGVLEATNTASITSGASVVIALNQRWFYDDVFIVNLNNDNDATVTINSSIKQPLPKGNSLQVTHPSVKQIKITNNGSTIINSGEIGVYYRHTGKHEAQTLANYSSIGHFALSILGK